MPSITYRFRSQVDIGKLKRAGRIATPRLEAIACLLGVFERPDALFLVMEFCAGGLRVMCIFLHRLCTRSCHVPGDLRGRRVAAPTETETGSRLLVTFSAPPRLHTALTKACQLMQGLWHIHASEAQFHLNKQALDGATGAPKHCETQVLCRCTRLTPWYVFLQNRLIGISIVQLSLPIWWRERDGGRERESAKRR